MNKPNNITGEFLLINGLGEFSYYITDNKYTPCMPKYIITLVRGPNNYDPLEDNYTEDGRYDYYEFETTNLDLLELGHE